jgi:hypothetical protein
MVERSEQTPEHMPLTLLNGDQVETDLEEKNGLFLPKGTKVLLTLGVEGKYFKTAIDLLGIGPTVLHRDFEGVIDTREEEDKVKDALHYPGMRKNSIRVYVIPDSELRRGKVAELEQTQERLKPLHLKKHYKEKITTSQESLFRRESDRRNKYFEELREIDRQLKTDFLEDRQGELDRYFIDRKDVKSIRLGVAVDRNIEIPSRT